MQEKITKANSDIEEKLIKSRNQALINITAELNKKKDELDAFEKDIKREKEKATSDFLKSLAAFEERLKDPESSILAINAEQADRQSQLEKWEGELKALSTLITLEEQSVGKREEELESRAGEIDRLWSKLVNLFQDVLAQQARELRKRSEVLDMRYETMGQKQRLIDDRMRSIRATQKQILDGKRTKGSK